MQREGPRKRLFLPWHGNRTAAFAFTVAVAVAVAVAVILLLLFPF